MTSPPPVLLVVTGLQREARIAAGKGVATLCSGGNPDMLRQRLAAYARTSDPSMIRGVLSFGLAGGLARHLRSGDVVISTSVEAGGRHRRAHDRWRESTLSVLGARLPVHSGPISGRDVILAKSSEKVSLHEETGALAVDMESHIAADYAQQYGLPFAAIRAISDPCSRNLPPVAMQALTSDGNVAIGKVMIEILRDSAQLPALIAAGMDSERAFASLRRCRRLLGPLFGLGGTDL
ncbi:MAG: phosphorylase [Pseudomonadota bacterium]